MSITITKQASNQKIKFFIEARFTKVLISIYRDDEYITCGDLQLASDYRTRNKDVFPAEAYGIVAACCPVSENTYNELQEAVKQVQAEIDNDPKLNMEKLIAKRESLVEHYNLLLSCKHDQHVENIEDISEYGHPTKPQHDYDADLAAADKAIQDFDAAHIDVLIEIEHRKNNRINKFLASD
jgi:hypothetical protein